MSALGQKRTLNRSIVMSALLPKADIRRTFLDSLDQLVGALLEVKRNVESKRLGRLEIND
jgi:hypothetical protein